MKLALTHDCRPLSAVPRLVPASFRAILFVVAFTYGMPGADRASSVQAAEPAAKPWRETLLLHASFDQTADADTAAGDKAIWNAPALNQRDKAQTGLPAGGEVKLEPKAGRFGGALRFVPSKGPMVFFRGAKNFPYSADPWSATISFWLCTDPPRDLPDGYCDPLQITSKQWDDASMFVEFEKRPAGIPFRLGVYADKNVWNPTGRKFEDIPAAERPLVTVEKHPYVAGKWVHVTVVLDQFNSGEANGLATLYLDGQPAGAISRRRQTFTWDLDRAAIMPGLSYVGLMDDLAIFGRALTASEVAELHALPAGVGKLK